MVLRLILHDKNPKSWDQHIGYVCSALDSIKSRAMGHAYQLHKTYKQIIHKVRKHLNSEYKHSDMEFYKKIRNKMFEAGGMVYVLIRCTTHKFSHIWHRPVPVLKKISDHVYPVKIADDFEKVGNITNSNLTTWTDSLLLNSKDLGPCAPNKKGAPKGELTLRTSVITHGSKGEFARRDTFFIGAHGP